MPRKKNYRKGRIKRTLKGLFFLGLFLGIAIFLAILSIFVYFAKDLPNPEKLADRQIIESTKIFDRTGAILLYDIHGEEKRTIIPFGQMPDSIKNATLVIEDVNFYHHFGIDFKGILRALIADVMGKKLSQGGSTITQQFIKSSFLTPEKTFSRKIKEAILSIELELKYPKDKIFEAYLNQIPYGANAYGIEAAAQTYFNKNARDLILAESALLAALPQAPSYYSPYGSHFEELKGRQEYILDRMQSFGFIAKEEAEKAKQEKLAFNPPKATIKAPHFVMYVKEYLEEKYGQEFVEKGGLKVYTTIDWELQQLAEDVISNGVKNNEKKYRAYNGALIAISPKTGQILAMAGSKDYFAEPSPKGCNPGKNCRFEPNVNVAIRERQPGSSFKPFAYAVAFKKGYTPETVIFDLPTEFNPSCPASAGYVNFEGQKCYNPQNYTGNFSGPVILREALAQSLNVPSVKVLYLAGVNETINLAQDLGITTLKDRSRYGLALVLGGGEVKLLDMTSAFGVFANEGVRQQKTSILKIETAGGDILEEWQSKPVEVLDKQTSRIISDILSDNKARTPVFGPNSPLYLPDRPVAAKTGTTQEYRDAWTIGYTPSLAVGVWAGNNDNAPMTKEGAGLYAAAPLWNEFMKKAYEIKTQKQIPDQAQLPFSADNRSSLSTENSFLLPSQVEEFIKPETITTDKPILNGQVFAEKSYKIDKISGKLITDQTPPELIEERKYGEVHCILYYVNKDYPLKDYPTKPSDDPQFSNWENSVLSWARANNFVNKTPPSEYDDVHIPENLPIVQIVAPHNNSTPLANFLKIKVLASANLSIKQIDFFFDNTFIGTDPTDPYEITYYIPSETESGEHKIRAITYDQALNRQEDEITIFLE